MAVSSSVESKTYTASYWRVMPWQSSLWSIASRRLPIREESVCHPPDWRMSQKPNGRRELRTGGSGSHLESEEHHVALLDHVFLALRPDDAPFAGALPAGIGDKVVVADGFGANEPALEVGVNHARGHRSGVAAMNRPGADFLLAGGEVRLESEKVIAGLNQPIEPS